MGDSSWGAKMSVQRNSAGKWVIDFTCKGKRITRVIGGSKREAEAAGGDMGPAPRSCADGCLKGFRSLWRTFRYNLRHDTRIIKKSEWGERIYNFINSIWHADLGARLGRLTELTRIYSGPGFCPAGA